MRVCCFCEKWESGGIESFLHSSYSAMDLTDIEVDIVASELAPSIFTSGLEKLGVKFFELSGSQRRVFRNYSMFRKLLNERRYDIIHLNAFQGLSFMYLAIAKKAGVPVRIAHSHNTALRKSTLKPVKMLIHRLAVLLLGKNATERWACSSKAAEFLFGKNSVDYRFIPNGIDAAKFKFSAESRAKLRSELGIKDKFVVINVGRLCYQKNQRFLIELMPELRKSLPNCILLLIGEGDELFSLKELADKSCVSDIVHFLGVSDKVSELLSAADVFAFPSMFEGLGIVAVEAQAAGLPVLCSENVPHEAFVTPLAEAVPLSDTELWIRRFCELAENVNAGERSISEVSEFDIQKVAQRMAEFYRRGYVK